VQVLHTYCRKILLHRWPWFRPGHKVGHQRFVQALHTYCRKILLHRWLWFWPGHRMGHQRLVQVLHSYTIIQLRVDIVLPKLRCAHTTMALRRDSNQHSPQYRNSALTYRPSCPRLLANQSLIIAARPKLTLLCRLRIYHHQSLKKLNFYASYSLTTAIEATAHR